MPELPPIGYTIGDRGQAKLREFAKNSDNPPWRTTLANKALAEAMGPEKTVSYPLACQLGLLELLNDQAADTQPIANKQEQ